MLSIPYENFANFVLINKIPYCAIVTIIVNQVISKILLSIGMGLLAS